MGKSWPYWKKRDAPEEGVYRLMHFCGVQIEQDGEEHPIAVFESMRGYLNFACPIALMGSDSSSIMDLATIEDAEEEDKRRREVSMQEYPGSVGELAYRLWSVAPGELRASGLTRTEFYKKEITEFMARRAGLED